MEGRKKRTKKKCQKKYKIFSFPFFKNIKQYNNIQLQYNHNNTTTTIQLQLTTIQPTTMQQQDNLPPRISDSHFIHTQTVTCTTKHFGNDMIL